MPSPFPTASSPAAERLRKRLAEETRAEVRFDLPSRALYSTDASLYQIPPVGVVVPRTSSDVATTVRIAAEEGIPVLPRGSATSLSGQTVGVAVVIDHSKYLNRIGVVDRDRMTVRVEPGVVLDQLNAHLKSLGLFFGPDVSTSDRATLGGMLGNNSAGARSLRYGKTAEHVESLSVVLSDGGTTTFGPLEPNQLDEVCARDDLVGLVHRTVRDEVAAHRSAIESHFPHILRRVSGYNLDEFIPGLPVRPEGWQDPPWRFNLSKLIVGSEGTLALIAGAELKVMPAPRAQGLVVLSFASIPAALDRLAEMLETGPVSVEMLDRMILDLAAANPEFARSLNFAQGRPEAVLAAQYYADSQDELAARADDLVKRFEGTPGVLGIRKSLTAAAKDDFWKIRKAGLSLLMGLPGDAKPVAFVEDTAVSVDRLPEFYRRFEEVVAAHGTTAACYGHADVGCLHIRPVLDTRKQVDIDKLRSIAGAISDLVVEFGGSMSGEHGDGLARSKWNRKLFGEEVYGAFLAVKRAFDPHDLLNPGKVVAEPDPGSDLRYGVEYHAHAPSETALDFSRQGGFASAVELCSGVGACRKTGTGTMCPSYMITREEEHSTRGRANMLRLVMSGQIPGDGLSSPAVDDALDLCLQCKACKTECPSNVDMAKLKAEYLHQKYRKSGTPLGSRLLGNIHRLNPIGAAFAPLANFVNGLGVSRALLEKTAGLDRRRELPRFHSRHLRKWFRSHVPNPRAGASGKVVLLDDCFTTYNDPGPGIAAVQVLEAAGYSVELAHVCCGRAAISKGLLDTARHLAADAVAKLAPAAKAGVPIVGVEPSCLLTLADELRDFRLGPDADAVADASVLVDRFVAGIAEPAGLNLSPLEGQAMLHGHCQQKAITGTAGTLSALRLIPGLDVRELDSGCCGMAGSFGYELGHYDLSKSLAERVLLPSARAEPHSILVAPGFSCRSQVHGLAGLNAIHPIELIARQLAEPAHA